MSSPAKAESADEAPVRDEREEPPPAKKSREEIMQEVVYTQESTALSLLKILITLLNIFDNKRKYSARQENCHCTCACKTHFLISASYD